MKKNSLFFLLLLIANLLFAQDCNLIVFSEGGERFYLILNGIQHNQTPETNVKVQALPQAPFKAKVVFEDKMINPIEKTLYTTNYKETTYSIRLIGDTKTEKEAKRIGNAVIKSIGNTGSYKEKPKQYKIRLVSETPLHSNSNTNSNQQSNVNNNSNTQVTTTTTTSTNVNNDPNNANINMNVNISESENGESVSMNMNVSENTTYNQTTTVNTSTTTSSSNDGSCSFPMGSIDFEDGKKSISSKTFADSKMTIAKQITKNNCPTAQQIKEFTMLFTFESSKLEYAKFAYNYCFDRNNYYKVNDAFEFETSIDELNGFIER